MALRVYFQFTQHFFFGNMGFYFTLVWKDPLSKTQGPPLLSRANDSQASTQVYGEEGETRLEALAARIPTAAAA